MSLFRIKPHDSHYVEAIHDVEGKQYFAQKVDKDGKGVGPVNTIAEKDFTETYEPAKRLPTNKKPAAPTPT